MTLKIILRYHYEFKYFSKFNFKEMSSVQDDGSHTRMTRRLGADGLISPTLSGALTRVILGNWAM